MKTILKKTLQRKNNIRILKISAILSIIAFSSFVTNIKHSVAYNTTLSEDNDSYPIYALLSITFNNKTNSNIQASLTIINESTGEYRLNYDLLSLVEHDLSQLPAHIPDLVEATIYDYNDSFVPGCVYILLSASEFSLTGTVFNSTVEYILVHPSTWWYVQDLNLSVIDLKMFGKAAVVEYFGLNDTKYLYPEYSDPFKKLDVFWLVFSTLHYYYSRTRTGEYYHCHYSFVPGVYDIVNNTIIVNYLKRENVSATFYLYNGTNWIINLPFVKAVCSKLEFLNNLYFFQHNNITLELEERYSNLTASQHHLEFMLDDFSRFDINATPVFSANTTESDIGAILSLGTENIGVLCSYHPTYPYPEQESLFYDGLFNNNYVIQLYLTVYFLFSHLWFCDYIQPCYLSLRLSPSTSSASLSFIPMFAFFVVSIVVATHFTRLKRRSHTY